MSEHKGVTQHPRQLCYFCGSEGPIQTHHIVPQRHGGNDEEENLVDLCPTCHERIERLYDKRFYQRIDVDKTEPQNDTRTGDDFIRDMKNAIGKHEREYEYGVPVRVLHYIVETEFDLSHEAAASWLSAAKGRGEIYEANKNRFRTT
jgi:hypothetical protein